MARIFSINFIYNDEAETAMISVKINPFITEYIIGMMNEELALVLPGNRIISNTSGELSFANTATGETTELMQDIINAIQQHLQPASV